MIALTLAASLTGLALQSTPLAEALLGGDYRGAWEMAESEPEGLSRSRARAEVLYSAGDPSGALSAARAGLAVRSDDLRLLFLASGASIWLQEAAGAERYSRQLWEAVVGSDLNPEEREGWLAVASNFGDESRAILEHDESVRRSIGRARGVSLAILLAVTVCLAWGAYRGQGRSSSPVS